MSKMIPKITIEQSKNQHIETPITSEWSKILTFRKKRWHHKDGIFQRKSTCFFDPGPPCCLNRPGNLTNLKIQFRTIKQYKLKVNNKKEKYIRLWIMQTKIFIYKVPYCFSPQIKSSHFCSKAQYDSCAFDSFYFIEHGIIKSSWCCFIVCNSCYAILE